MVVFIQLDLLVLLDLLCLWMLTPVVLLMISQVKELRKLGSRSSWISTTPRCHLTCMVTQEQQLVLQVALVRSTTTSPTGVNLWNSSKIIRVWPNWMAKHVPRTWGTSKTCMAPTTLQEVDYHLDLKNLWHSFRVKNWKLWKLRELHQLEICKTLMKIMISPPLTLEIWKVNHKRIFKTFKTLRT